MSQEKAGRVDDNLLCLLINKMLPSILALLSLLLNWTPLIKYMDAIRTEGFDTVTTHFIDDEWDLHSAVLRTSHLTGAQTSLFIFLTNSCQVCNMLSFIFKF